MKNIICQIINIISISAMTYFAIPKLLAKPQSIAGFKQFEHAIHLDADFFRVFTGISELGLAVLLVIFAIGKNKIVGKLAFSFLLITMLTALGLEFFARPEPVTLLVVIAFVLALLSIYKIQTINFYPKNVTL